MQHREEILDATKTDLQQQIDDASQENAGLRSEIATMGEARQEVRPIPQIPRKIYSIP
jgi:hypothetical protein